MKLWEIKKNVLPVEAHTESKARAMIKDAFKDLIDWSEVIRFVKTHDVQFLLETFYRLWKERRDVFDKVSKKEFGWGKITRKSQLSFLSTIQDAEFLDFTLKYCDENIRDNEIIARGIISGNKMFITKYLKTKTSFSGMSLGVDLLSMQMFDAFADYFSKTVPDSQEAMVAYMLTNWPTLSFEYLEKLSEISQVVVRRALILDRSDIILKIKTMREKFSPTALLLLE